MSSISEDSESLMPQPVKKNQTGNSPLWTTMTIHIHLVVLVMLAEVHGPSAAKHNRPETESDVTVQSMKVL